jgi:hypothetical protein
MIIGDKTYDQIVVARENGEVIAVISDDDEIIVKDGYTVHFDEEV